MWRTPLVGGSANEGGLAWNLLLQEGTTQTAADASAREPMSQRLIHRLLLLSLTALGLVLSGCLSSTYAIEADELERLASLPPDARSGKVRVVQRLSWADEPPLADDIDADEEATWYPEDHRYGTPHCHSLHFHHHSHGHIVFRSSRHSGHSGGHAAARGGTSGGGAARVTGTHGGSFNVGGQKAFAFVVVAAAGVATVGLVATEGARFDGYARLEPDHPLHLRRRDGSYQVVRLENLEPHHLDHVSGAVVDSELSDVSLGRRAPLDREGFAWKFELGGMQLRAPGDVRVTKTAALMELGYFPTSEFGLLTFVSLAGGNHLGGDVFGSRYGLTAEWMPLHLGRVHLGGYGLGGLGYDAAEGGDLVAQASQYWTVGGGALLEFDVTTRMGLSVRAGADWQRHGSAWSEPAFMTTVGVAVY